jgi:hypothetical protein
MIIVLAAVMPGVFVVIPVVIAIIATLVRPSNEATRQQ